MRLHVLGSFVGVLALLAVPAVAEVHVTIADGNVSVSAKDATIRQILAEWARVGQTRIINVERVSGAPLSIELTNVPEAQALDTVLRSVSGYLAAPRAVAVANASRYDRIYLLPTSTGAPARPTGPQPGPQTFTPGPPVFAQPDDEPDDVPAPRQGPAAGPSPLVPPNGPRGPTNNTFPQAPPIQSRQAPASPQDRPATFGVPSTTSAPVGVSTPGMVVPAPQQQGQSPSQLSPGDPR